MPITAIRAGACPSSGVLTRITASSAACSTATQIDVSACADVAHLEHAQKIGRRDAGQFPSAQTSGRGDRLHRICVPAAAANQRPRHCSGSASSSFGPVGPSA